MKIAGEEIGEQKTFPFCFVSFFILFFLRHFHLVGCAACMVFLIMPVQRTAYMCMRAYKVMPIVYIYWSTHNLMVMPWNFAARHESSRSTEWCRGRKQTHMLIMFVTEANWVRMETKHKMVYRRFDKRELQKTNEWVRMWILHEQDTMEWLRFRCSNHLNVNRNRGHLP